MTNSFLVRLGEPGLAILIFALVQDVVVRELGRGFHSAVAMRDPLIGWKGHCAPNRQWRPQSLQLNLGRMMRTILLPQRLLDCKCVLCDLLFGYIPRFEQAVLYSTGRRWA
jgi:hypothetical protein